MVHSYPAISHLNDPGDCDCPGPVHFYSRHLKAIFGRAVAKAGLNLGVPCPHRFNPDGPCVYCHPAGFRPFATGPDVPSMTEQIDGHIPRVTKRYRTDKVLAYFQAETSTAGTLAFLGPRFEAALSHKDICGMVISTRPDAIDPAKLDFIAQLGQEHQKPVWMEYGVQSLHDRSLRAIKRGHDAACALSAIHESRQRGLGVGVHTILGLPGESLQDMIDTHRALGETGLDTVKIHHLQVYRDTALAAQFETGQVPLFDTFREYIEALAQVLRHIPWDVKVQRVITNGQPDLLLGPVWDINKQDALGMLKRYLLRNDIRQGDALNSDN